jgi:phytoene desaturase
MYRACFADGSELAVRAGIDPMTKATEAFAGRREAASFRRFAVWLGELHDAEFELFILRPVPRSA